MATSYPGAVQVGSYFVTQYYQVLQQQPELVHQFYSDNSTMVRVDGESRDSATAMMQIDAMIMSLNFTAIEIKTINSVDSWNGGVLVMVSGAVKAKDFSSRRNFVQTFFLAPQEKGFFVLNDIFQFIDDGIIYHHHSPVLSENKIDAQLNVSSPLPEPPASDYVLEEEARDYVNSVHIEDDLVDKYSIPEQPRQEEVEAEIVVEETPVEETSFHQNLASTVQEPPVTALEEPVGEPAKRTYASILRVVKEQAVASVPSVPTQVTQPSYTDTAQYASDWNYIPEPTVQQTRPAWSDLTESAEAVEESLGPEEGEFKSVYVRNLPSDVTAEEIEEEFKNFGRIKPDGVFVRNRKDVPGVCYAFVEFEDILAVQNAIKASPIHLAGRQVYIEERRPNTSGIRGGRRGGRGRGSYASEAPRGRFGSRSLGRGNNQDSGDYRARGNGYQPRGSR
ncbi:hypothetical protein SLA2020_153840 [Shorea laevis]